VVRRFEEGDALEFGNIKVSKEGLSYSGKDLSWLQVSQVACAGGYFAIKQEGGWGLWCSLPVKEIPNVLVMLELINRVKRVAQRIT
jgi:hypothetical protein